MQKVYSNGISIEVEPFDLECKGASYKIDLLYYNKINRYGEVLTSLVFNSGIREAKDTNSIVYAPNKLFNNNAFERSYVLNETSTVWKNMDLVYTDDKLLKDNSYSAVHTFKKFDVTKDYAVEYANGEYAYDGWYKLVSLGLEVIPYDSPSVVAGDIRYDPLVGYAEYSKIDSPSSSADWQLLNIIDPTIPIYNLTRLGANDIFSYEEFMVTVKINTLYKKVLDKELDNEWFSYVNMIRPKLQTINFSVENKLFGVAQHMIESVNNSLLALLI